MKPLTKEQFSTQTTTDLSVYYKTLLNYEDIFGYNWIDELQQITRSHRDDELYRRYLDWHTRNYTKLGKIL